MLITFKTRAAYPNITMFGDVALKLVRMMGRRDTVPSAIDPDDVPLALQNLRTAIAVEDAREAVEPHDYDDDKERPVSLHNRALPLIELLEAAVAENVHVMWESGSRSY